MSPELEPATAPERIVFAERGAFSRELKARSDAYFDGPGGRRRDLPRMYLKTLVILTWLVSSWALLVFAATTWWQGVLAAMSLGLAIAGVGMAIQHDANHGGYSTHPWVNRAMGFTLDVMGVCGFIWKQKHNIIHHTFTNIEGVDFDLDFGYIARLSREQPRRVGHRFQAFYLWFLYGFLLPKWVFYDDFVIFFGKKMGPHKLPKMSGTEIALFFFWKLFFVGWAIVIPALYHPLWQVLCFHLLAAMTLGITLATVFQLAHCVDEADFPPPKPGGARMEEWTVHQLATTVDFAPKSALLTWFLGGLNFQVEHHLFPKACHLHYPALARIVSEVAAEHGVRHRVVPTLRGAIAAHIRHLNKLGRAEEAADLGEAASQAG